MAPEFGVDELPLTNDNIIESKEMESEDIEDGEILEDESNQGEEAGNPTVTNDPPDEKNNFERFFPKEKKVHHHHHHRAHDHQESHRPFRRDRSSFSGEKKRKSSDEDAFRREKYYGKKSKRNEADDDNDEDMIFMLGGSLRDVEQKPKPKKSSVAKEKLDAIPDHMIFNEGENEDPRPYARRSPSERREKMKKDRGILVRGVGGNLIKRRGGRGGPVSRKEKPREPNNDACLYFAQGKCQRGNDCPYLHAYNQPRKLEICKFYLNDCCNKRDKCIYMHSDFPCKYFHMPGLTCSLGTKCKFSHSKLDEVQRAVLKKYADIPIKEVDEAQRFFREVGNSNSRTKDKKDLRIPSLLNLRVAVPPEYREGKEGEEGDGVTTPIPSPESMAYENNESDEVSHKHHHKRKKPTAELNNHDQNFFGEEGKGVEPSEVEMASKHKKRSRKSDDSNEGERSRKHSDKKRKKSKKDEKDGEKAEKKKKKKEHKRHKLENGEDDFVQSLHEDSFGNSDSFEVNTEEKSEREPDDAFAHLPKKQQELFLRIQQHQKEADISQSANMDKMSEEDDGKVDFNWYSSDEEETPEPVQETASPLATLLRTIRTSSCRNDIPHNENQIDAIPTSSNLFSTSADSTENESVPIVDASQLANIDLSDDITKILSSIMKTDAASSHSDTISNSLPLDSERGNDRFSSPSTIVRTPFPTSDLDRMSTVPPRKPSAEEIGLIFRSTALFGSANTSHTSNDTVPKDIDLRQLPFKPVPVHDAANEIDASITSHPPMEYKLKPLPPIPKVNYGSMIDTAKVCANDPRFKKVDPDPTVEPTVDLISKLTDPRFEFKLQSEPVVRVDPRIRNDPRLALAAGKNVPTMTVAPKIFPLKTDPRVEKESTRFADSRDPRLLSCNKFPQDGPYPFQMAAVAAAASLPQSIMPAAASVPMLMTREPTPLRKEDPRLRYRANHNV